MFCCNNNSYYWPAKHLERSEYFYIPSKLSSTDTKPENIFWHVVFSSANIYIHFEPFKTTYLVWGIPRYLCWA